MSGVYAKNPHGVWSHSYREFDVKFGTDEYEAWESWMKAHGIPPMQVPLAGWACRDTERNTVSVLTFWSAPGDDLENAETSTAYPDTDDSGNYGPAKDVRYAVLTVQLKSKPLPFPYQEPTA